MERHLRGGADHQTVIFVPIGDTDMWFDMRLLHFRYFVFCFEDFICFSKAFFHVADVNADMGGEILFRIRVGEIDEFRLIVNANRIRFITIVRTSA